MKNKLLALIFTLSTLSLSAYDVDINGFINVTAGKSDNDETSVAGYENTKAHSQSSNGDSVKFQPDSLIGLQISSSVSDNFSVTLQLIGKYDNDVAKMEVEWAYIAYGIEHLQIQVGRYRPAIYMYANTQYVAHSYLWTRLPTEVYSSIPISYLDGINIIYNHELENEVTFGLKAYYGNIKVTQTLLGIEFQTICDDTYGAELTLSNDYANLRMAYSHTTLSAIFGTVANININNIDGLKIDNNQVDFYSLGLHVDYKNVVLISEIVHRELEPSVAEETIDSYYVTLGYHIDKFTPNITYASLKAKFPNNDNPLVKRFKGEENNQQSITAGVRYEINPSAALKVEWMQTEQAHLKGRVSDTTTNLYTLSLNLVF